MTNLCYSKSSVMIQTCLVKLTEQIHRSTLVSPRIAVLASGGVDSSVVVHLLCSAGYKPTLFYIQIGAEQKGVDDCAWEDDITMVKLLARKYHLPLEIVSLHDEYWSRVVQYTIDTVRQGLTPNPDVMCNKLIKFGVFDDRWGHKYDFIATGHYATISYVGDTPCLSTAKDPIKDQTDFLAQINFKQISKLLFPIGYFSKEEVRLIAQEAGLPMAQRRDSQGICFLGKVNYNTFIEKELGENPGRIIDRETGRVLGLHRGYWFHTIGQRKGLGLSGGPWFVVKKDIKRNILLVSKGYDPKEQYGRHILMNEMNFVSLDPWGYYRRESVSLEDRGIIPITFKVRHSPEFYSATLNYLVDTGEYRIDSEVDIQGIAPGQYAVVYDKECTICFGSGVIVKGF